MREKGGKMEISNEKAVRALCDRVRQTAFELHAFLKSGHLEKVYGNGLANRLRKAGLRVERQKPLQVIDEDGTIPGSYLVDLLGEGCLLIGLTACKSLSQEHFAQAFGYLRAAEFRDAMLINFGSTQLQI
jgi:GxxExxY protein